MTHLFVTNDFPPKIGGIQTMLWELWRRLDPTSFTVLTTPHPDSRGLGRRAAVPGRCATPQSVLLPTPSLARRIEALADEVGADVVVLDPALPVGLLGPRLAPPLRRRAARGRDHRAGSAAGPEPRAPPRASRRVAGDRRRRLPAGGGGAGGRPDPAQRPRAAGRRHRAVPAPRRRRAGRGARAGSACRWTGRLVVSLSRLGAPQGHGHPDRGQPRCSPRPDPTSPSPSAAAAGTPDASTRLIESLRRPGRACWVGVSHDDLPELYGCADVYAMLCRNRWAGLEQEGFGIVFLEAAAAGVPQVAGDSGGAAEAVVHGETGPRGRTSPHDAAAVAAALARAARRPGRRGPGWAPPAGSGPWRATPTTCSPPASGRPSLAWEGERVAERRRRARARGSSSSTSSAPGALVVTSVAAAVAPDTFTYVHAALSRRALRRRHGRAALGLRRRHLAQPHRRRSTSPGCSSSSGPVAPASPPARRLPASRLAVQVGRRSWWRPSVRPFTEVGLRDPRADVRARADGPVGRPPRHVPRLVPPRAAVLTRACGPPVRGWARMRRWQNRRRRRWRSPPRRRRSSPSCSTSTPTPPGPAT